MLRSSVPLRRRVANSIVESRDDRARTEERRPKTTSSPRRTIVPRSCTQRNPQCHRRPRPNNCILIPVPLPAVYRRVCLLDKATRISYSNSRNLSPCRHSCISGAEWRGVASARHCRRPPYSRGTITQIIFSYRHIAPKPKRAHGPTSIRPRPSVLPQRRVESEGANKPPEPPARLYL